MGSQSDQYRSPTAAGTTRVLITGAAGRVGRKLRPRLARPGRVLRLLDTAEIPPPAAGEDIEIVRGSVTDMDVMERACQEVDAVIHLAGHSREAPWRQILEVNIGGTYTVFEAARRRQVPRVVFASSTHATGYSSLPAHTEIEESGYPRPDTNYGVGKVTGEVIGSLYADRYDLDVVCVRIGLCFGDPGRPRMLGRWLSADDCARLFDACLTVPAPGFRVVWGVSGQQAPPVQPRAGTPAGLPASRRLRDPCRTVDRRVWTTQSRRPRPPLRRRRLARPGI